MHATRAAAELGDTHTQIADVADVSRSAITHRLRTPVSPHGARHPQMTRY